MIDGADPRSTALDNSSETDLEKAKKGARLLEMDARELGKYVRGRWDRHEKQERVRAAELKVCHLRWRGIPYAEIHPSRRDTVFLPPDVRESIPLTENKIGRSLDRYIAQITADDPVLQAMPAKGEDDDRDKANAATHALRGEVHRMRLNTRLKPTMMTSGLYRSAFRRFYWDSTAGPEQPATIKRDVDGTVVEVPVDEEGVPTSESGKEQATIAQGELCFRDGSPFQVRYTDGVMFAHEAPEIIWGELVTLRELFDTYPAAKKLKLQDLLHGCPPSSQEYLEDLSGKGGKTLGQAEERVDQIVETADTGEDLDEDDDAILDSKVFFLYYYLRKNRVYRKGYYCYVVGKVALEGEGMRGTLEAWRGVPPVVHYKFLHDPVDKQGRGFIDVTRGAQNLEDFVLGHILRWLQSLQARYLIHTSTNLQGGPDALRTPHDTPIAWSGTVPPARMEAGQFPAAFVQMKQGFDRHFDDQTGLTESARGLHVPGVQSGEHVKQLVLGTETLLGLTRDMMIEALQAEGQIILRGIRHYWKRDRRVAYFGRDKQYVEKNFSGADFGSTDDVLLVKGSLLMMTPQQRSQMLMGFADRQLLTAEEFKLYMPFADVTGTSLDEDPHYLRARRQNEVFLEGPSAELVAARTELEQVMAMMGDLQEVSQVDLAEQLAVLESQWHELLSRFMPTHLPTEDAPYIARIHFLEHAKALARDKADEFLRRGLDWWIEPFLRHAQQEGILAGLLPQPAPPEVPGAGGGTGAEAEPSTAAPSEPGAQGPPPPAPAVQAAA